MAAFSLLVTLAVLYTGCSKVPKPGEMKSTDVTGQGSEILASALTLLDTIERFNTEVVELFHCPNPECQFPFERRPELVGQIIKCRNCQTVFAVPKREQNPPTRPNYPFAVPQTLSTVLDRLNQWIGRDESDVHWERDPLIDTLPDELRTQVPALAQLDADRFTRDADWPGHTEHDGWALLEVLWLRDASETAAGESIDPLTRAASLFDWTVRQIQLETPDAPIDEGELLWREMPLRPWQTLLLGRGLAAHRAWIFCLLARQQGLHVVLIQPEQLDYPLAAAVTDTGLYLFDPQIGLPLPGLDGQGIATLAQAAEDPAVLRQWDLPGHSYPLAADDLKDSTALIEAGPVYLAERMARLGVNYVGRRPVLAVSPTNIAARARELGAADARLWEFPFRTCEQLRHLSPAARARFDQLMLPFMNGPGGRPMSLLFNGRSLQLRGVVDGEQNAYFFFGEVRVPDKLIANAAILAPPEKRLMHITKAHSTYWLGLLTASQGDFRASTNHLGKRTLDDPDGAMWGHGARLNLALAWAGLAAESKEPAEARRLYDKAIDILRQYETPELFSPHAHGCLLRARQLESLRDALPSRSGAPPL